MEFRVKTRFCPVLETSSILFPRVSYGIPLCEICPTKGVPVPSNVQYQYDAQRNNIVVTFSFGYLMSGTDYFLFRITKISTNEKTTIRFAQASQYAFGGFDILNQQFLLEIIPVINDIPYSSAFRNLF